MNSYKVEFAQTLSYVLDVQAESAEEAEKIVLDRAENGNFTAYDETETGAEGVRILTCYDVTGTDDDAFRFKKTL